MENKKIKHIMIILWRWRQLEDHAINDAVIQEKYQGRLPNLGEGRGVFFTDYAVEYSRQCPNALVVAANIYQDGELTQELLDILIEQYTQEEEGVQKEVMLLLHRGHNYKEGDVSRLLQKHKDRGVQKVFLFANGHDYIYHGTRGHGFLDDNGGFALKIGSYETFKKDHVAQPYFDRVWFYYSSEFESKVYALKEELMEALFPLLLTNDSMVLRTEVLARLKPESNPSRPDNLLWYRLKSFCGKYNHITEKNPDSFDAYNDERKEVDTILKKGLALKQSLLFDDCIANLEQEKREGKKFASETYEELLYDLDDLFFQGEADKPLNLNDLRQMGQKFNYLVKIIPGVMD